ncbi:MAG: hypothetical protein D6785_00315, partial [Planctomycetota bacterium]
LFFLFLPFSLWSKPVPIQLLEVTYTPETETIFVEGKVNLRNDSIIIVRLWFHDEPGLMGRGIVKSGKFQVRLKLPKKNIVPGQYIVRAEFLPRTQSRRVYPMMPPDLLVLSAERKLYLGDPKKEKEEVENVKKFLVQELDILRQIFSELVQRGDYLLTQVKIRRLKGGGKLDASFRSSVARKWSGFYREYWSTTFKTVRYNFHRYQKLRFLSPYPKAEKDVLNLINHLNRLFASYTFEIFKRIKKKIPQVIKVEKSFGVWIVKRQIEKLVKSAGKNLGVEIEEWPLVSMNQRERGKFFNNGNTYRSYVTKFEITKPSNWQWSFGVVSPSIRLRILPKNKKLLGTTIVAVEIFDYPQAENFKDLEKLTIIRSRLRYRGYKEIKSRSIKAPDSTMPGGVRPGYEIILTSKDKNGEFEIRQYELFCRWHKRTYGVVCIAKKGYYEKYEKIYDKICKSFKVLDDPNMKHLADLEKKEMKKEKEKKKEK